MPRLTLDHADVIGAVSNGQRDGPLAPLHQLHHLGLLQRRHPAADDGFAQAGHVQEEQLQPRLQSVSLRAERAGMRAARSSGLVPRLLLTGADTIS